MFALKPASAEQLAIVEALGDNNLIVDAVAGSGKTTTILAVAARYKHSRILVLTYNARLRAETQDRLNQLVLDNVSCHTYHSFAFRYISERCSTDSGLIEFARNGSVWTNPIPRFDIVIIDECQDMTPLLYLLSCAILRDNSARMCVMGDQFQSIYGFMSADSRFLTHADKLFARYVDGPWRRMQLTTSYRITREMASFVNFAIPNRGIQAIKDGPKVIYADMDIHEPAQVIWKLLQDGVPPEHIFVIAPSVRSTKPQSPIRACANELTRRKVAVFVPSDDEARVDSSVLKGKIVFSSFHQSKGLERPYVICFGIDRAYYKYFARGSSEQTCANPLYVAFTRASHQLMIYIKGDQPLAFLRGKEGNQLKIEQVATLNIQERHRNALAAPLTAMELIECKDALSVTEMCKHIPSVVLDACMRRINVVVKRAPDEVIEIPNIVRQGLLNEEVSAISGVSTVAWHEMKQTGRISWLPIDEIEQTPEFILRMATMYIAQREKLQFRPAQIRNYDWITEEIFEHTRYRLVNELGDAPMQTEVHLARNLIIEGKTYSILGAIDVCVGNRIIEVKTTSQLSDEHVLQVMLYRWQMCSANGIRGDLNHGDTYQFELFNVRTNELRTITATQHDLDWIVKMLLCKRMHTEVGFSDEEFVHSCGVLATVEPCAKCIRAQM
jgi:AAA domain/UvrD-like helicase C-terminal domain